MSNWANTKLNIIASMTLVDLFVLFLPLTFFSRQKHSSYMHLPTSMDVNMIKSPNILFLFDIAMMKVSLCAKKRKIAGFGKKDR